MVRKKNDQGVIEDYPVIEPLKPFTEKLVDVGDAIVVADDLTPELGTIAEVGGRGAVPVIVFERVGKRKILAGAVPLGQGIEHAALVGPDEILVNEEGLFSSGPVPPIVSIVTPVVGGFEVEVEFGRPEYAATRIL